jgi:hypothetical protein
MDATPHVDSEVGLMVSIKNYVRILVRQVHHVVLVDDTVEMKACFIAEKNICFQSVLLFLFLPEALTKFQTSLSIIIEQYEIKYLFQLSSFTHTSYWETAHSLTPDFFGLFHIYTIILHLMRAEYYYLLLFSHPTFPFMFNFVKIFS